MAGLKDFPKFGALSGLKILDSGSNIAGPFAGGLLSEAGAIGLLGGLVGCVVSMLIAIGINLASFPGPFEPSRLIAAVVGIMALTGVPVSIRL